MVPESLPPFWWETDALTTAALRLFASPTRSFPSAQHPDARFLGSRGRGWLACGEGTEAQDLQGLGPKSGEVPCLEVLHSPTGARGSGCGNRVHSRGAHFPSGNVAEPSARNLQNPTWVRLLSQSSQVWLAEAWQAQKGEKMRARSGAPCGEGSPHMLQASRLAAPTKISQGFAFLAQLCSWAPETL